MAAAPRVLVSWYYSDQVHFPPPRLSPNQVTLGRFHYNPEKRRDRFDVYVESEAPDLAEALERAGVDRRFDLVLVFASTGFSDPYNLAAFDCPKVLGLADTHHDVMMGGPIRPMINAALREPYDGVFSLCDHQHLHFLADAGVENLAFIPGIQHEPYPGPDPTLSGNALAFVGSVQSGYHNRRDGFLDALVTRGVPIVGGSGIERPHIPPYYATSRVSFNCSLNNDLNTRIFEILSAGGLLLTDRLSPLAGLSHLLEEGHEYLAYGDAEELLERVDQALADPDWARGIAAAGVAAYRQRLAPEHAWAHLTRWILDGDLDPLRAVRDPRAGAFPSNLVTLRRRTEFYERVQMAHMRRERTRVLCLGTVPPVHLSDVLDLPRLEIGVVRPSTAMSAMLDRFDPDGRVARLSLDAVARQPDWDALVTCDEAEAAALGRLVPSAQHVPLSMLPGQPVA